MPVLQTRLDSLDFSTQLDAVRNALATAQTRVTFWGTRIVEIDGHSSSYTLETLVQRFLEAGKKRCDADNLTLAERAAGLEIDSKFKQFYQITDEQIPHCNFFTRLLVWIREFSFLPYTTRFHLEDGLDYFQAFSPVKFILQFGGQLWGDPNHIHPAAEGSFGPPQRIVAKQERILEALRA